MMGILLFIVSFVWAKDNYNLNQTISPKQDSLAYEFNAMRDTLISGDSIIVIHTVCAPICSSHACVYNKEWQKIGELKAPFKSAFPEAYIEDGEIIWRDNDSFDYTPTP